MKKIRFYKNLLVCTFAFILSHAVFCGAPEVVAANGSLTASDRSSTFLLGNDWNGDGDFYIVKYHKVFGRPYLNSDAYVNYRADVSQAGWYRINHKELPAPSVAKDKKAQYIIRADDREESKKYDGVNQNSFENKSWSTGDDLYCFDGNKDNAFTINTGAHKTKGTEYTYAPKNMTLEFVKGLQSGQTCKNSNIGHTITIEIEGVGNVTGGSLDGPHGNDVTDTVLDGSKPSYTFTPGVDTSTTSHKNYVIDSLVVDGEPISVEGGGSTYTFSEGVYEDKKIVVVFGLAEHKITASVVGNSGGSIIPFGGASSPITSTGDVFVADGGSQEFTFIADPNYIVSDIIVDGESVINNDGQPASNYTFSEIDSNHTIQVKFSSGFIIDATASSGGTIDPVGEVSIVSGDDQTFNITPNNVCYEISDVKVSEYVNGVEQVTSQGAISSYTFLNVVKNYAIHAEFAKVDTDITISSISSGYAKISPEDKNQPIGCDTDRNYTIYYEKKAADLYVYINDAPIKILEAGKPVTPLIDFTHTATPEDEKYAGKFEFTVYSITEDTVVRLHDVVELADYPLDIVTRPAPPNIMFVLDDSGSMGFEFMTEENEGKFKWNRYIYGGGDSGLSSDERKMWRSRYFDYNKIYYDPSMTYQPWPNLEMDDISREFKVKTHPEQQARPNFLLSSQYMSINRISIPNAHYFIENGSDTIILVALNYGNKEIEYYRVAASGDFPYEKVYGIEAIDRPSDLDTPNREFMDEAQNFANWFTFYRNRQLTATSAIARVIDQVSNTYIGILTIQGQIKQAVAPVRVQYLNEHGEFVTEDDRSVLFDQLYDLDNDGGTPLRSGLKKVGHYYDQTDNSNGTITGRNPWFKQEEGGACQQSFTIAMTDGYYNGNLNSVGSVGNVDAGKGQPYADGYRNTLADIAMYYYEKDLVSSLANSVPGEGRQHMKTYGVAFGVEGRIPLTDDEGNEIQYTLEPCSGEECNFPKWCSQYNNDDTCRTWTEGWPNPTPEESDNSPAKIDDLFHASVNGRGLYLNASNPQKLVDSLSDIIVDISDQSGSAASVSVNGDQLYNNASTGELLMYQTQYTSPDWVGKVYAYQVATDGTVDTETPIWEASEKLDAALNNGADVNDRIIATYKDSTSQGISFNALTNLSDAQQAYFDDGYEGTEREDLFQYIRGSNAKESLTGYRVRNSRLGDIVNSGAYYHGWYAKVYDEELKKDVDKKYGYIYVGANDGMMHAFDAETGDEKFAYIPSMVLPNLKSLASQTYGDGHRFFVDGTPIVTKMGNLSYLVGGLGKGGKGYYSINVTNAHTITSSRVLAGRVLWEYPKPNVIDNDLGNTFSKASTIKSYATNINSDDDDLYGYVTFFGNGYGSVNGNAVLYFLDPKTGRVIKKIDVGGTSDNGMGTPTAIDVNNDNKMDYIYAGDLEGNMWKFDVQDENPDNWQVAYCESDGNTCKNTDEPRPLVTTADGQAITSSPDITRHPSKTGYMVVFGTGRFLSVSDWDNNTTQSFYGIWDFGDDEDNTEYLGKVQSNGQFKKGTATQTFTLLQQREVYYGPPLDAEGNNVGWEGNEEDAVKKIRVLSDNKPNWSLMNDSNNKPSSNPQKDPNGHAGWVFNLPLTGERSTVDTIIRDGKAIMVSFVLNGDRCAGGADSLIHEIDVYTGGRLSKPAFDVNGDGVIDDEDMVRIPDGNGGWILVPPSAIQKPGRLQAPAIVGLGKDSDIEVKHLSSSSGKIETVVETSTNEESGVYYWREF